MGYGSSRYQEVVITLLEDLFSLNCLNEKKQNWNVALTSPTFGLSGTDLVYLLFELEKKLNVRISMDNLMNYKFNTICSIIKLLEDLDSSPQ